MKSKAVFFVIGFGSLLTSCQHVYDNQGIYITDNDLENLKVGMSRQTVFEKYGTPSLKAPFDPHCYFYVGIITQSIAFFKPKVIDSRIVRVQFNDKGKLAELYQYNPQDVKMILPLKTITPLKGHDRTILQQIMGNFGRFTQKNQKES